MTEHDKPAAARLLIGGPICAMATVPEAGTQSNSLMLDILTDGCNLSAGIGVGRDAKFG